MNVATSVTGFKDISGAEDLNKLAHAARLHRSPCGEGDLVMRQWMPHDSGAQDHPPVVLLHGGGGSWRHWARSIPHLARSRPVIAMDMPGYGDSALPPEPVSFATLGQIIATGVDAILPADARYHIAGFSLGSFIAPHVATASRHKLASLTLIHGHFWGKMAYTPRNTLKRWRNIEDMQERREILRHNLGQLMLAHPESADEMTIDIYAADLEKARLRVETFIGGLDTTILNRITAPLLAISGALDPTGLPSPGAQQEQLHAARPDARCIVLDNVGHWAMWEDAIRTTEWLDQWLRTHE